MLDFLLRRGGFLLGAIFLLLLPTRGLAMLPLTAPEILLMLRGGSSQAEVAGEINARKVLEPLTPELRKQLLAAGADTSLLSAYEHSQLNAENADAARADLEQRKKAAEVSRARTLEEIAKARAPAPFHSAGPSSFLREIESHLVTANAGRAQKYFSPLTGKRFFGIYFSASWCGPCRRFTPELVQFYQALKKQHDDFEIFLISRDKSEAAMLAYMIADRMPWPALEFEFSQHGSPIAKKYSGDGIPNLVLVDAEGAILSQSYRDGQYVGPEEVLRDWMGLYAAK